jgi:hypothetical protein
MFYEVYTISILHFTSQKNAELRSLKKKTSFSQMQPRLGLNSDSVKQLQRWKPQILAT